MSAITSRIPTIAVALVLVAVSAYAWGPRTQVALVNMSVHVLARDGSMPVTGYAREFRQGASLDTGTFGKLYPGFARTPVGTIESEMELLKAMRGSRLDPYMAYRLGVLGQMVSRTTAPLARVSPAIRDQYYADVDGYISQVRLEFTDRKLVDPPAYFKHVTDQAASNEAVIVDDYRNVLQFNGVARGALPLDAARTVNAVADTWYTVLSGGAIAANIAPEQITAFVIDAMRFYVNRGNIGEVNASYSRLNAAVPFTVKMREQVGDLMFDGGFLDRAMEEYLAVVRAQPDNRHAAIRIAEYYMAVGDEALGQGNLTAAIEAYTSALDANKLNDRAQRMLIEAQSQLAARNERMDAAQASVKASDDLQSQAEREAMQGNYAMAMSFLKTAEGHLLQVTDEFPAIRQTANVGMRTIQERMGLYKNELLSNAQQLSGSGFGSDARRLASQSEGEAKRAFRAMIQQEYNARLMEFEQQAAGSLGSLQ